MLTKDSNSLRSQGNGSMLTHDLFLLIDNIANNLMFSFVNHKNNRGPTFIRNEVVKFKIGDTLHVGNTKDDEIPNGLKALFSHDQKEMVWTTNPTGYYNSGRPHFIAVNPMNEWTYGPEQWNGRFTFKVTFVPSAGTRIKEEVERLNG